MKHIFTLTTIDEKGTATSRVVAQTSDDSLAPAACASLEKLFRKSGDSKIFLDLSEHRAGRPGNSVYIIGRDEDCSIPVEDAMILPAASDLARILDVSGTMVTTYLRRAKEKGEIEATIKGVHFCYLEDWGGSAQV